MFSNQTFPVVFPTTNPIIGHNIAPTVVSPQKLLMPAIKKVVTDAALGGTWFTRTPQQIRKSNVNRSTPGEICNAVRVKSTPSPFLIGIVSTYPPCGLSRSQEVAKKRKPTSPGLGRNTQNLDVLIDRKLSDDLDSVSISSKAIGYKLSGRSIHDLYLRFRINFLSCVLQTQATQFMNLGLLTINKLNESSVLGTIPTSIQRSMDGAHWSAPDHVSGEVTAVRVSAVKSNHKYNSKTYFQIWRENK